MPKIRHTPDVRTYTAAHPAGDTIDRHRHDEHQLIYVSTGVIAATTAHGTWVATPERALWIPAGVWHEHRFHGHSSFHSVGFATDVNGLPHDVPAVVAAGGLIREVVIACTEPGLEPVEQQHLLTVLTDRLASVEVRSLTVPHAEDLRLADACRLVTDDLTEPRTLPWLAHAVGASERTLTRLFRTEFGTTYPQWRTQVRILEALIHLAEGASVTDTALHCGWSNTSTFINAFNHAVGQTPGQYRTEANPA